MGKEWVKVRGLGKLYLEQVLFSFDVPILFVCVDYEGGKKYLCLKVDTETVIAEVKTQDLLAMLENRLPMEKLFRAAVNNQITVIEYDKSCKEIKSHMVEAGEISADMLPEKDAMLEIENSELNNYIEKLKNGWIQVTSGSFCEKKQDYENPNGLADKEYETSVNEKPLFVGTIGEPEMNGKVYYVPYDKLIA